MFKRAKDIAIAYRGKISAVNTDRNSQFYASGGEEKKKGPKSKSKTTEKLEKRVLAIRFKSPEKDMYKITDILTEEGYNISARSVGRVLSEHGVT